VGYRGGKRPYNKRLAEENKLFHEFSPQWIAEAILLLSGIAGFSGLDDVDGWRFPPRLSSLGEDGKNKYNRSRFT